MASPERFVFDCATSPDSQYSRRRPARPRSPARSESPSTQPSLTATCCSSSKPPATGRRRRRLPCPIRCRRTSRRWLRHRWWRRRRHPAGTARSTGRCGSRSTPTRHPSCSCSTALQHPTPDVHVHRGRLLGLRLRRGRLVGVVRVRRVLRLGDVAAIGVATRRIAGNAGRCATGRGVAADTVLELLVRLPCPVHIRRRGVACHVRVLLARPRGRVGHASGTGACRRGANPDDQRETRDRGDTEPLHVFLLRAR